MTAPVVLVAGALANKPRNGGEAWVRLSWIRGLVRLGCDVWFVEQVADANCTDGERRHVPFAVSENASWFRSVTERFGLAGRSALVCDTGEVEGVTLDRMKAVAQDADLLVDISGNLTDPALRDGPRTRAYVDIDPGFTQIWHANGTRGAHLEGHDLFFTIGERIGTPDCPVPDAGVRWRPTRQPVLLDDWPVAPLPSAEAQARFTTVATWRGPFGPVELDRRRFGLKVHEFRKYIAMPDVVPFRFEAALAIHPDERPDLDLLDRHGWVLADPMHVACTPERFRDYVAGSGAEFSVAQGVYVDTAAGWFSDRTVRYLASGRPALVQDTGLAHLPTGAGLVTFSTFDEAVAGAHAIVRDWAHHADAARRVAERCFSSDVVLSRFLDECGLR